MLTKRHLRASNSLQPKSLDPILGTMTPRASFVLAAVLVLFSPAAARDLKGAPWGRPCFRMPLSLPHSMSSPQSYWSTTCAHLATDLTAIRDIRYASNDAQAPSWVRSDMRRVRHCSHQLCLSPPKCWLCSYTSGHHRGPRPGRWSGRRRSTHAAPAGIMTCHDASFRCGFITHSLVRIPTGLHRTTQGAKRLAASFDAALRLALHS